MSDMPPSTSALPTPPAASAGSLPSGASASGTPYVALTLATLLALGGLASSALLWQKLNHIQEQLARQSADRAPWPTRPKPQRARRKTWRVTPPHA